ncbi:MAG: hypothetical protein NT141_02980 [candidate division WWE3 bacterium]|nr:hypothetical protein [candidate division WWE3 bacterium]
MTESMKEILADRSLKLNGTVNSTDKSLSTVNSKDRSINTVNSNSTVGHETDFSSKFEGLVHDFGCKSDYIADKLATDLGDIESRAYYTVLAENYKSDLLLEALALTLEAYEMGIIRTRKPIYFLGILRHWDLKTKFSRS